MLELLKLKNLKSLSAEMKVKTSEVGGAVPLVLMDLSLEEGPVGGGSASCLLHTSYKAGMAYSGKTGNWIQLLLQKELLAAGVNTLYWGNAHVNWKPRRIPN